MTRAPDVVDVSEVAAVLPVQATGPASVWVLEQLAGPVRTARVLHAGHDAVYLDLGGSCVGILGAGATQVPCGISTTVAALPPVRRAAGVDVGGGTVSLPGLVVTPDAVVDLTVPALTGDAVRRGAPLVKRLVGPRLDALRTGLPALEPLAAGRASAVGQLCGLGPGLTPVGDDVLAGWLATAASTGHPRLAGVCAAVTQAAPVRTTTLSATLLDCACRGEALPELRSLLTGLLTGDDVLVARSLELLLLVGGTSGAGLALGLLLALEGDQR